jgi:hypothetical protein
MYLSTFNTRLGVELFVGMFAYQILHGHIRLFQEICQKVNEQDNVNHGRLQSCQPLIIIIVSEDSVEVGAYSIS